MGRGVAVGGGGREWQRKRGQRGREGVKRIGGWLRGLEIKGMGLEEERQQEKVEDGC